MKRKWTWIWMALALALLASSGTAAKKAGAAEGREPALRVADPETDAAALARIEVLRKKLPVQFQRRNNFAWAVARIEGLQKVEYFAHSGIQNLDDLSADAKKRVAGISLAPERGRFEARCVNQSNVVDGPDCWVRTVDTEYKILEDMAARLPDSSAQGCLRLYTDLAPCASCWDVMKQFLAVYTNVQMQVLYKQK